jgi:hypothetical protein
MINLQIEKATINPEALDGDLKAALGEACFGVSAADGIVTVHLAADATPQQQAQAESIVEAHDAGVLTPEQTARQAREGEARKTEDEAQWAAMSLDEKVEALRQAMLLTVPLSAG